MHTSIFSLAYQMIPFAQETMAVEDHDIHHCHNNTQQKSNSDQRTSVLN